MAYSKIKFGTIEIPCSLVYPELQFPDATNIRQGPPGRSNRDSVRPLTISSLHKGIGVPRGREARDLNNYKSSDLLTAPFESVTLPYVVTAAAFTGSLVDFDAYRTDNKRVHSVLSTLGQSKLRLHWFYGSYMARTISDSNSAVEGAASFTNMCRGAFEGRANSTRYIFYCTDGTTDDVSGIADPTLSPPVLTSIFALAAGDYVGGGFHMPNLGPGYNIFYGKIGGINGLWYLPTTYALLTAPTQIVATATKDVLGTMTTTSTGNKSPTWAVTDQSVGNQNWQNPTNCFASDNSRVSLIVALAAGEITDWLIVGGFFDGDDVPPEAYVTGIKVGVEKQEVNAADDVVDHTIEIRINNSSIGANRADRLTEWPVGGAEAYLDYGSSIDPWGAGIRGSDLPNLTVAIRAMALSTAVTGEPLIDHIRVDVTYRMAGAAFGSSTAGSGIPTGGRILGKDPFNPHTGYIIAPEFQDEPTTVNVPRILWKTEFDFDPSRNEPTVTVSKVYTSLSNIEAQCFALQGIVVSGESLPGNPGKSVRFINPQTGDIRDLGFGLPGGYTTGYSVLNLIGADRCVIAEVINDATTLHAWWMYTDGTWNPISKEQVIVYRPLSFAGDTPINVTVRRHYSFYPGSADKTVATARRQFQPTNLLLNPLTNDTTEVKEDGPLSVTLPDMDVLGPEEGNKSVLVAWCFSRDVSAANTIELQYATDGGSSFTSWGTFTAFGGRVALPTPVSFRTMVLRIRANHTASGAGTPNCLPLLIEGAFRWREARKWQVVIDPGRQDFKDAFSPGGGVPGNLEDMWSQLITMINASGPIQVLQVGSLSPLARLTDFKGAQAVSGTLLAEPRPAARGIGPSSPFLDTRNKLEFEEVAT